MLVAIHFLERPHLPLLHRPIKTHVIAPDRPLPAREAGPAVLSPLSRCTYITVTNAHKDQDTTLGTVGRGGLKEGAARRGAARLKDKRGESRKGRWGGRGQQGISFLLNTTERKWPFYTPFGRCGRAVSVDVNGVHGR